jgi:type IV secretory pathway TrbD component
MICTVKWNFKNFQIQPAIAVGGQAFDCSLFGVLLWIIAIAYLAILAQVRRPYHHCPSSS